MKKLFLIIIPLLTLSCSNDESIQEVTLKVNHYKPTAIGLDKTLVLMIQENEKIGTNDWSYIYGDIDGFIYEFGFEYELRVIKKNVSNPPADGSSVKYILTDIISKVQVEKGTFFELDLKTDSFNPPNYAYGNIMEGFTILNEINIDCNTICNELSSALANENSLKGIFSHVNSDTIKLESLIIE